MRGSLGLATSADAASKKTDYSAPSTSLLSDLKQKFPSFASSLSYLLPWICPSTTLPNLGKKVFGLYHVCPPPLATIKHKKIPYISKVGIERRQNRHLILLAAIGRAWVQNGICKWLRSSFIVDYNTKNRPFNSRILLYYCPSDPTSTQHIHNHALPHLLILAILLMLMVSLAGTASARMKKDKTELPAIDQSPEPRSYGGGPPMERVYGGLSGLGAGVPSKREGGNWYPFTPSFVPHRVSMDKLGHGMKSQRGWRGG